MTDTGGLRLTVPRRASLEAGLRFVRTQGPWITRERLRRHARLTTLEAGAMVWFRGEQVPVVADATHVQVGDQRWLRPAGPVDLRLMVETRLELAAAHGETVARVSVRSQRSRWGSCSTRRTIALNWRLVLMPAFVSDYVILHELMHLRQPNHSRAFWREVAGVCPEWREAERWLRAHGRDLL